MISALASQGRAEEALSLYEELKDDNLRPSRVTFQVRSILVVATRIMIRPFVLSNSAFYVSSGTRLCDSWIHARHCQVVRDVRTHFGFDESV